MALVNQVLELQQQGLSESEIIQKLIEQGNNPLEINQAIEQSKIKAAVAQSNSEMPESIEGGVQGMQQSVMEEGQMPAPQQQFQEYLAPEQPQQQYAEYPYPQPQEQYSSYQPASTENLTEITEQIIEEKINEIRKKLADISNYKLITDRKIKNIDERLKKIESYIEELQMKILGKISSSAESIQDVKKEMELMQDSFSKVINPLIDKTRAIKKK